MLWVVDGGMINLPVVARVEDYKEDEYIEITSADENHEWKSKPTRYENVVRCGECKYYKDGMCYNPNTYDDDKTCGNTTEDWFCADGKRKERNDEL